MSTYSVDLMESVRSIDKIEISDTGTFIACNDLIEFDIPDDIPWRKRLTEERQAQLPSCKRMIDDIIRYQLLWKSARDGLETGVVDKAKYHMRLSFIQHINVEEGIGTQAQCDTERILNRVETENEQNVYQYGNISNKRTYINESRSLSTNEQETENLCLAWHELVKMAEEERKLDPTNSGLIEMRQCVNHLHKILMTGVITEAGQTAPGVFSTSMRVASFNGEIHKYPQKDTQEEWETEISTLIDRYNALIEFIKRDLKTKSDKSDATLCIFKCAAWFLFNLVSLHPFSDGNGRLCRLLASYTLLLITPFPSSIYNIFSETEKGDYVEAIIRARTSPDKHPDHLAALMIESNWKAWRQFLHKVGITH